MFDNLISFFIITSLGVFFQLIKPGNISPESVRNVINTLVIKFFLPALCFKVIAGAGVNKNTFLLPVSAIMTITLSLLIAFIIYTVFEKFITLSKKEKGVLILTAAFGNVTFLGLLFLTGLYGPKAVECVLLYDFLAFTPLLWLVGTTIASYYGSGQKLKFKESLKTIMKLPPIWALIAGFTVNFAGLTLPSFLIKTLDLLSAPIIPLMTFSIGLTLTLPKLKYAVIAAPSVIIKLCLSPLLAFGIASMLNMRGLILKSTIMEAAMPTMILTLVISSQYKLDCILAAFTIVLTTVLSLITLPVISHLIQGY